MAGKVSRVDERQRMVGMTVSLPMFAQRSHWPWIGGRARSPSGPSCESKFKKAHSESAPYRRCRADRFIRRFLLWMLLVGSGTAVSLELCAAETLGLESTALLPPTPRTSHTLFTTVPSTESGIHAPNPYDDPSMWTDNFERFAYGSMGTGLAIGDYDGDGSADLYVVSKTGQNFLFRNLGNFRFEDVTKQAGVGGPTDAWKTGATFADVNNDGRLDLYVCRVGAANLLYLNQGDGTFAERAQDAGIGVADASVIGAFADFDRDGWLDLYLVTNLLDYEKKPDGQRDYLFRNRGDGTFEDVTKRAGIFGEGQKHTAVWWDYDADHWPDLYVTYDYGWPDQLFRNNRDGTFTNVLGAVLPYIPRFSMGADVGDVNNDGLMDLFVLDMLPTTRERDQRAMIDARAHIPDLPDARMTPQYMRNMLFLNTGTARFQEAAFLAGIAATDWSWSSRLEDFDNDGRLDLFVTNGTIREFFDGDLRKRIENLVPVERKRVFKSSPVLRERNLAFRNLGGLEFENSSAAWGLDHLGVSFGAATGDLDGDGDLDLVFANYDGEVTVCRNHSDTGRRLVVALRGNPSNRFGVGATVRIETSTGIQIRELAIARGYLSSSEPELHFGLGDFRQVKRLTVIWPSGHEQAFSDLAADRRYVITEPEAAITQATGGSDETEPAPEFVEVGGLLGLNLASPIKAFDELATQPLLPFRQNQAGPGLAIGDVNGDRIDDVVVGGTERSSARVMVAQPDGTYVALAQPAFTAEDSSVADAAPLLFDVNGDGLNDLLLAKGCVTQPVGSSAYRPRLYVNRGDGRFEEDANAIPAAFATSAGPAVAADFNRDGRLDVFIGGRVVPDEYPTAPRSALLVNAGGAFEEGADRLAAGLSQIGMVSAALWSDVDGDGWLDLLVVLQWGAVHCWRNVGGERFEDVSAGLGFSAAGSGWWNSIAAADFNGDGQVDYAVGNGGLNTRYQPTPAKPLLLLRGPVDETQTAQLLEAEYDGDTLVPVRGRSTMERVMPWIGKKMPTFKRYAAASLEEIFGQEDVKKAQRFEVTELRSGVFLSQPGGGFRFRPLPRVAQIAPIFGMVAGDFDGDGNADLYVVQNSYAPIPEIGRFAGGLSQLLRGDGKGDFVPASAGETYLVVPGAAKALATLDLDRDGWPEFVVTRAGDEALVFGNTGIAGRKMLAVSLRGRAGNPTGIGARITAIAANGSSQTNEVSAGSGYLSQSSAVQYFGSTESNSLKIIRVRWPWGETSETKVPTQSGMIVISAPNE